MIRRGLCCGLVLLTLLAWLPERAEAVNTSATAAILMDADSGRVLYEHHADARMGIASTTKLLTALVALREGHLQDMVTVSANAAGTEGSSMYLRAGEQLTLETLLYGLLLCSGNDAAVAIAEHISGSVSAFAEQMNALARELGMSGSSFANPSGLDHPDHYSTARDMARLACAAVENETLVRLTSTRRVTIGGRMMTNHNKLLGRMEGCIGLKTGYTRAAGRTLVSCAEKDGQRLVAVTLQDGDDWSDHQALYEAGFSHYPARRAAVRGEVVDLVPIVGGSRNSLPLTAAESFSWPLQEGEQLETRLSLPMPLTAPLKQGTLVGQAIFSLHGREVGRIGLRSGETVLPRLETAARTLRLQRPE